jgi:hypothetical protein
MNNESLRKGAKAQRKTLKNAEALCALAPLREKYSSFCAKPRKEVEK